MSELQISEYQSPALKANSFAEKAGKKTGKRSPLRADLLASINDGAAYGGMVGVGETYLPAFVLAVGLGEVAAGLVTTVPVIAGGAMQLVSPLAIKKLGSHKRWVVCCAGVQALSFLPLILAAVNGYISGVAVMLIAAVYWASGLATGPAWNTWIGTIVPPPIRARFFAVRTRTSQLCVFAGFMFAGLSLQYATRYGMEVITFAMLFSVAVICRVVSVWQLSVQSEPTPLPANMRHIPFMKIWPVLRQGAGGRLLVYLVMVQAAVQMSGPYFVPYMFKKLEMNYGQFAFFLSLAFLAKVIALPFWGKAVKRLGAWRLLWIGGIGITPIGAAWIVSQDFVWIAVLHVASGVAWAAYELAFFLLFFESIKEEERTSLLTFYNLMNTVALVAGALIGGLLLYCMQASMLGYLWLFGLSSAFRGIALLFLWRVPSMQVESSGIGVRTISVRPGTASVDAPVLPSLPDQLHD